MEDTFDRIKVPNFALGVDHFNALSYWTQGIILTQNAPGKDGQDVREKIMWKVSDTALFFPFISILAVKKMSRTGRFLLTSFCP